MRVLTQFISYTALCSLDRVTLVRVCMSSKCTEIGWHKVQGTCCWASPLLLQLPELLCLQGTSRDAQRQAKLRCQRSLPFACLRTAGTQLIPRSCRLLLCLPVRGREDQGACAFHGLNPDGLRDLGTEARSKRDSKHHSWRNPRMRLLSLPPQMSRESEGG